MIGRIREALRQGHKTWKWRHDTDILLRLLEQAEEARAVVRAEVSAAHVGEQVDPWQV